MIMNHHYWCVENSFLIMAYVWQAMLPDSSQLQLDIRRTLIDHSSLWTFWWETGVISGASLAGALWWWTTPEFSPENYGSSPWSFSPFWPHLFVPGMIGPWNSAKSRWSSLAPRKTNGPMALKNCRGLQIEESSWILVRRDSCAGWVMFTPLIATDYQFGEESGMS